ncbi:hypothetical protein QZH41_019600, partial [Actinostola sp. cb2023]
MILQLLTGEVPSYYQEQD